MIAGDRLSMKIPQRLKEFSVSGRGLSQCSKEIIRDVFLLAGICGQNLAVWDYKKNFRISVYGVSRFRQDKIWKKLKSSAIRGLRSSRHVLRPKDWIFRWKESYRVMPVGKSFLIIPAWKDRARHKSKRISVVLDPGSAFGTGGHETTQLMIRLFESLNGKFRSFFDAGTGSGVLAVVAYKLGAERIVAADHDAMSVKIAKKNFKANGCAGGDFIKADLKRLNLREKFNVVGANLLSKTLLECRRPLIRHLVPGGYLVLSGVARRHFKVFRKEFSGPDLRCLKVLYSRSWAAAIYRKI